jgi:hypothetical protein
MRALAHLPRRHSLSAAAAPVGVVATAAAWRSQGSFPRSERVFIMAKGKAETVTVSKADYEAAMERLKALENRQATGVTKAPGFYSGPEYNETYQGKVTTVGVRITHHGHRIEFKISQNGWMTEYFNFIPRKGGRGGHGGYGNWHLQRAEYYRSPEYIQDLKWCRDNGMAMEPAKS